MRPGAKKYYFCPSLHLCHVYSIPDVPTRDRGSIEGTRALEHRCKTSHRGHVPIQFLIEARATHKYLRHVGHEAHIPVRDVHLVFSASIRAVQAILPTITSQAATIDGAIQICLCGEWVWTHDHSGRPFPDPTPCVTTPRRHHVPRTFPHVLTKKWTTSKMSIFWVLSFSMCPFSINFQ